MAGKPIVIKGVGSPQRSKAEKPIAGKPIERAEKPMAGKPIVIKGLGSP